VLLARTGVSPSRAAAPAQASAQLWVPGAQGPTLSKTTSCAHSLKDIVPKAAAHVSVLLCGSCSGGRGAQRSASTAAYTAGRHATQLGRTPSPLVSCWEDICRKPRRAALLQPQRYLCAAAWYVDLTDRVCLWILCRSSLATLARWRLRV
jgi:hypothetical protein